MSTADPHGAQAHARAQAGTKVEAMPTLPPPQGFLWEETIAAGGYATKRLARGARGQPPRGDPVSLLVHGGL